MKPHVDQQPTRRRRGRIVAASMVAVAGMSIGGRVVSDAGTPGKSGWQGVRGRVGWVPGGSGQANLPGD